jgi:hypothetical protein
MGAHEGGQNAGLSQRTISHLQKKGVTMLYYAAVFIVMGLIGHVLYLDGVASVEVQMSWILVLIGAVVGLAHVVTDF